jgi:hypothetical protein
LRLYGKIELSTIHSCLCTGDWLNTPSSAPSPRHDGIILSVFTCTCAPPQPQPRKSRRPSISISIFQPIPVRFILSLTLCLFKASALVSNWSFGLSVFLSEFSQFSRRILVLSKLLWRLVLVHFLVPLLRTTSYRPYSSSLHSIKIPHSASRLRSSSASLRVWPSCLDLGWVRSGLGWLRAFVCLSGFPIFCFTGLLPDACLFLRS